MISLQTNTTSLMAQQNLNTDNAFQSKTIQELTSGYRINSSGDDAAGLAIANGYRSSVAELTQGVSNANDGISQLQIIDGGLSNISTILDRMKTLATQSASGTFTGSRATLNQEYSGLITELNRQAANINLNSGGTFNTNLSVYIGGAGTTQSNASVNIDLSGASNAVDATSLGLASTDILGGGVGLSGNTQRVDATGATFVKGTAGTNDQSFTFNVFSNGSAQTVTAKVSASANGSSLSDVLSSLNGQLNKYGISAGTDSNGLLQFSGASAFTVADNGGSGTNLLTNNQATVTGAVTETAPTAGDTITLSDPNSNTSATITFAGGETAAQTVAKINAGAGATGITASLNSAGTGINFSGNSNFSVMENTTADILTTAISTANNGVGGASTAQNTANNIVDGAATYNSPASALNKETMQFETSSGAATVTINHGDSLAATIANINAQTAGLGVSAVLNAAGTGISLQGTNSFSVTDKITTLAGANPAQAVGTLTGVFAAPGAVGGSTNVTSTAPSTGGTNNGSVAITAINAAIANLGLVQGSVGAGENKLAYATSLAQSQISSYSAAESQIRDADVAAQAANLTKAQVLVQTSVAALAQANSAPQAILKLLQG
jgi:flagellin